MDISKLKGFLSFTLFALALISCASQEERPTKTSQPGSTQGLKIKIESSPIKPNVISPVNKNVVNIVSTTGKCAQKDDSNDEFIRLSMNAYMRHQTLYTGGFHFKALDSVLGSSVLYFMMSNRLDLIQEIKVNLGENNSWSFSCGWLNCPLKMLGGVHTHHGPQNRYKISPRQVMRSAIRVLENQEKAYTHLNKPNHAYSVHFGQAVFDLDIFTSRGEPVDWWLPTEFPKGYGHLQFAVWEAAKQHDMIDWLQFTATTSYRNHLQNWAFKNATDKRAGYQNLAIYAATQWKATNSYAWLSALAEVVEPSDPQAQIVIHEFNVLADKVQDCNVTAAERLAFWTMYTNALRIGSALKLDMAKWLTADDADFQLIKSTAIKRMHQYLATTHSREKLKELPSTKALYREGKFNFVNGMVVDSKSELLEPKWLEKQNISLEKVEYNFINNTYLRYVSFLSAKELISLYLKLEPVALTSKLFDKQYQQKAFRNKLRPLVSSAFIRDWIINDLSNDGILEILARSEPELKEKINLIIAEQNNDSRRLMLFKMVLQSPGMTYQIGIPLSLPRFTEERNRTEESIAKLITSNPEDGNWWCTTDSATIVNRLANDMAQPFGYNGADRSTSGGSWGTSYYNPGQKRSDLRPGNLVLTAPKLHEMVVRKYQEQPYIQRQIKTSEWQTLETLPSAPVYFSTKLNTLLQQLNIDRTTKIELYKGVLRASHRTCREDVEVHEVYRKTKEKLRVLQNK